MRTSARATLTAAVVVAAVLAASPQPGQKKQLLFVENSHGGDVAVIDAVSLTVVNRIDVGLTPDEIVASPSGDILYLTRIVRPADGKPGAMSGEFVAIDPATQKIAWRTPLKGSPNHIAVSPDGKLIYVTIVSGPWVVILDAAKHAVVDSVDVGTGPHDIEVSHDGKTVYVGLIRGTDVTMFDATTRKVIRKIPFGENVRPIAVGHDEKTLYVQLSHTHAVVVADPKTGKILRKVAMPVPPGQHLPDSMPIDVNHGLRITADGKFLIANGSLVDLVAIFSLPDLKLMGTVPVGHDPNWIALSPDGKRAFVSNRRSDDVSVIDLATRKEIARVKSGNYPQRMAVVSVGRP